MGMISNVAEKAKDIAFFRELAARLQQLPDNDWTEWEWEWLGVMARKSDAYAPSDRERLKLAEIYSYSESFAGYDGLSVATMVCICYRYHLDFPEEDSDFVVDLHCRQARTVRKRQLRRLVKLCAESGESTTSAWTYLNAEPA
ncbi:hypothetical protein JQ612_33990 [Bradyrhizobium manausense]|uniref:hypothetical protein n=1 Tax=Bradyrhizobium manausense TaxID=989370 RepID=UPI001BA6C790|nr:hypothetical protein [Bradyrhizobium manausense]MBR0838237.1 hypothetical protein [Bradyrhizobium manausense]